MNVKENIIPKNVALILFTIGHMLTVPFGISRATEEEQKIGVIVTIAPVADFVQQVGGDKVDVAIMVPPGASPHTYEPTPGQLRGVSRAKMYVKVGSGVEFELVWLDKILAMNREMAVIDASKGISLLDMGEHHHHEGEHGLEGDGRRLEKHEPRGKDPHIWLSPRNALIMVENIFQGLVAVDPENGAYYAHNRDQYLSQLQELDEYVRGRLSGIENRWFMVYHPSWGYFARDYDLEQIPIERAGKEPTVGEIKRAVEMAWDYDITALFVSPQFTATSARVIAKEIGGEIKFIDPLAPNYIQNLRTVVDQLALAMR